MGVGAQQHVWNHKSRDSQNSIIMSNFSIMILTLVLVDIVVFFQFGRFGYDCLSGKCDIIHSDNNGMIFQQLLEKIV